MLFVPFHLEKNVECSISIPPNGTIIIRWINQNIGHTNTPWQPLGAFNGHVCRLAKDPRHNKCYASGKFRTRQTFVQPSDWDRLINIYVRGSMRAKVSDTLKVSSVITCRLRSLTEELEALFSWMRFCCSIMLQFSLELFCTTMAFSFFLYLCANIQFS